MLASVRRDGFKMDIDAGRVSDPLAIYAPVPTNYDPALEAHGRREAA